jgi:hypothetical protein
MVFRQDPAVPVRLLLFSQRFSQSRLPKSTFSAPQISNEPTDVGEDVGGDVQAMGRGQERDSLIANGGVSVSQPRSVHEINILGSTLPDLLSTLVS